MDKKQLKEPKKITPRYLENAALYYLQRFATSSANFKKVLRRKIDKSCAFHKTVPTDFYPLVDKLAERYIATGLLNDPVFARAKTSTLRRQGKSQRAIEAKLQHKGLSKIDISSALTEIDESETAELDAAVAFVKRKKLGQGKKEPQKEMAVLGRAGFSYDIARKALSFKDEDSD